MAQDTKWNQKKIVKVVSNFKWVLNFLSTASTIVFHQIEQLDFCSCCCCCAHPSITIFFYQAKVGEQIRPRSQVQKKINDGFVKKRLKTSLPKERKHWKIITEYWYFDICWKFLLNNLVFVVDLIHVRKKGKNLDTFERVVLL